MLSAEQIEKDLARLRDIVIRHKGPGARLETRQQDINGVEQTVFAHVENNLREIYQLALKAADRDFLVYQEERYSFAESLALAEDMAQVLIEHYQLGKGDRVAICSRNYPEWCLAFMAITMIGGIAVPMNSWWHGEEIRFGLEDSDTRLLFADQPRIDQLQSCLDELDIDIISIRPQGAGGGYAEFFQLAREARQGPRRELDNIVITADDDASIMYTSGSTGRPKGVLSTHRNIISALYSWLFVKEVAEILRPELVEQNAEFEPAILSNVPLFHVTGCHAQFLLSFLYLRKFVMMYKWDPEIALALIEQERISVLHGVPTMTWEVMNSPRFEHTDLSSLRNVQSGGAARPPGHLRLMQQKFSNKVQPGLGYGLTETNAIGATITGAFYFSKPDSTGRPTPPVTALRIVDESGRTLPNGETGEICLKGATVMKEYWKRPEDTAAILRDGWFRTGDLGLLDEHGFLIIKDRAKDIVIRGGENVACAEVEYALNEHPAVHEAAVYGLPDQRLGEIVAATVMTEAKTQVTADELRTFLGQHIAAYKIPSIITLQQQQLERLASGKIAKKALREQALTALKGA